MFPRGSDWESDSVGERAAPRAPVTPRVYAPSTGEPLPLADCVRRLIDRRVKGVICLFGPPGSGKTTALAHLQAVLPPEICPRLVDRPLSADELLGTSGLTLYTDHQNASGGISLRMTSWGLDDCIEYLLAAHPAKCASVMARIRDLPNAAMLGGRPELWRIVLDAFAADESLRHVAVALRMALEPVLTLHGVPIGMFCLESLHTGRDLSAFPEFALPTQAGRLIRHRPVQLILAADHVVEQLCEGKGEAELENALPDDLIAEISRLGRFWPQAIARVDRLVRACRGEAQSMAVSIAVALDPHWRPTQRLRNLTSAVLSGADFCRVNLSRALLRKATFSGTNLHHAKLRACRAERADFSGAKLRFALLERLKAGRASFVGTDLSYVQARRLEAPSAHFDGAVFNAAFLVGAELTGASLRGARFIGADLSRARLRNCDLDGADFTDALLCRVKLDRCNLAVATFDRANFSGAGLRHCNLAGMRLAEAEFSSADLQGADLTDAVMPGTNFEKAHLSGVRAANVDWEGANLRDADLRRATFHLGSTRSGLVGSTIPCEGSRTGFYTDEYGEQEFKCPEEIRKANLRGADLRGANIDGVDFYLVDLRDALYSPDQRRHFKACRAIL